MRVCGGDNRKTEVNNLCEELSICTEGFSGADIAALCRAAAVRALENGEGSFVQKKHFQEAMECDVHPSCDDDLVQRLAMWRP